MNPILAKLAKAKEQINPAVALHLELAELEKAEQLDVKTLLLYSGAIDKATALSNKETRAVERALRRLKESQAIPSNDVPVGF
jgi:hypothetical protein